jgi:hypothetical protein
VLGIVGGKLDEPLQLWISDCERGKLFAPFHRDYLGSKEPASNAVLLYIHTLNNSNKLLNKENIFKKRSGD